MIRDDTDPAPSSVQQAADTIEERVDLRIYLTNKEGIKRMPQGVELSGLGPAAAFAAYGHFRLILVENLNAGARHHIAQPRGVRGG